MAAIGGYMNILVTANNKPFNKTMTKTTRRMRRDRYKLNKEFQKLGSGIKKSMAVGIGSLTAASVSSINYADNIAKLAKNARLNVVEFQKLSHSWELAGSSQQALMKSTAGLARNIFQLELGSKTAVDAFAKLNLTFGDLRGLSTAEQFELVIQRLRETTNETDQLAIAQQLLGRAGKEIAPILQTTSEELKRQGDRLQRLGGVVTPEAAKNAEWLKDEYTLFSKVLKDQFTKGLLGAVTQTQNFDDTIKKLGEAAFAAGKAVVSITEFIAKWHKELAILGGVIVAGKFLFWLRNIATLALGAAGVIAGTTAVTLLGSLTILGTFIAGAVAVGGALYLLWKWLDDIDKKAEETGKQLGDLGVVFAEDLGGENSAYMKQMEEAKIKLEALADSYDRLATAKRNAKMDALGTERFNIDIDLPGKKPYEGLDPKYYLPQPGLKPMTEGGLNMKQMQAGARWSVFRGKQIAKENQWGAYSGAPITPTSQGLLNRQAFRDAEAQSMKSLNKLNVQKDILGTYDAPHIEREKEKIKKLTKEISDSFRGSMREAFRTGNFSKVGSTLVDSIRNAMTDRIADKVSDMFSNFLEKIFDKVFSGGGFGGGGGGGLFGGIFGIVGSFFGGIFHSGTAGGTRGIVPGKPGEEKLVLARAGEEISMPHQRRGGNIRTNYDFDTKLDSRNIVQNNYFQMPMTAENSQYTQLMMPALSSSAAGAIA